MGLTELRIGADENCLRSVLQHDGTSLFAFEWRCNRVNTSLTILLSQVQTGHIIASNMYQSDDAPRYRRGNSLLIVLDVSAIALFVATKLYYISRNRSRARRWDAMTDEQREEYLRTTKDEGNKRLDFRFSH